MPQAPAMCRTGPPRPLCYISLTGRRGLNDRESTRLLVLVTG